MLPEKERYKAIIKENMNCKVIVKVCSVCLQLFETTKSFQNICSSICRKKANGNNQRIRMRLRRHNKNIYKPCEICGYDKITEIHHEGEMTYILCPNHHAILTRGIIKTIEEMLVFADTD